MLTGGFNYTAKIVMSLFSLFRINLTLHAPIKTIISLQDQPATLPSHYQNIPYQPKTTVPIRYPESTPDTNYQSLFR